MEEDILSKTSPLIFNSAETLILAPIPAIKEGVTKVSITNSYFLFDKASGLEKLGIKHEEFTLAPNLTIKTLQKYVWAIKKRALTAEKLVEQIIHQPVTKTDRKKRGYIYVYQPLESFGFVKIGYSRNVEGRLEGWELKCRYLVKECKDLLQGTDRQAPHPRRLEALIHAELKDKRYEVLRCEACDKGHTEWFEVADTEAQKVVKKWTSWMQTAPYDEDGNLILDRERPVVGDCGLKSMPVGPKTSNSLSQSSRRSSNLRQSMAASRMKPPASSTHHMPLRSSAPLACVNPTI